MARIGGRSTAHAWIGGLLCLAVVAGLCFLAMPMLPVLDQYFRDLMASFGG